MKLLLSLFLVLLGLPVFAVEMVQIQSLPPNTVKLLTFNREASRNEVFVLSTKANETELCHSLKNGSVELLEAQNIRSDYHSGVRFAYRNTRDGISYAFCPHSPEVELKFYQCNSGQCYKFMDNKIETSIDASLFKYRVDQFMAGFFDGLFLFEYLQGASARARDYNAQVLDSNREKLKSVASALAAGVDFNPILLERAKQETVDYFMINLLSARPIFPSR